CFQHTGVGGIAGDGADIEAVLQVAQHLLVLVHDGHLVRLFAREVIGRGTPDLTGPQNDDLHRSGSRLAYCTISHFVPCCSKLTSTRACGPLPSTFRITPSPNLPCRTRAPSRTPGAAGSSGRKRPTETGRDTCTRGRTSSSSSSGISLMKRDAMP